MHTRRCLALILFIATTSVAAAEGVAPRQALFGELHVRTQLSFDAFIFGVRATPDDAYRYARGEAITHPAGFAMQLDRPLDFIAVTDHAMYLGIMPQMADPATRVGAHPISRRMQAATTQEERLAAFYEVIGRLRGDVTDDDLFDASVARSAWQEDRNDNVTFPRLLGVQAPGGQGRSALARLNPTMESGLVS
ncbi:MAG: DUF3604 domain-containing protein [Pseudomonadales bacterium]